MKLVTAAVRVPDDVDAETVAAHMNRAAQAAGASSSSWGVNSSDDDKLPPGRREALFALGLSPDHLGIRP